MANWDLLNEKDGLKERFGTWRGRKVTPTVQNVEVKLIYAKHQKANKIHEIIEYKIVVGEEDWGKNY